MNYLVMPILDYMEIAQANTANGQQDNFELFARDFLEYLGYEIISGPNRGADGGRDLIIQETFTGIRNKKLTVRWMVSCKHHAHSGRAVTPDDERSIRDRVEGHECDGFMGFYSTLPSSGLSQELERLENRMRYRIYDREIIEGELLCTDKGRLLAQRYFPSSFGRYAGGIRLDLRPGSYVAIIKGSRSCELRSMEVKPGEMCRLSTNKGDNYIQWIYLVNETHPTVASLYDFSEGVLPKDLIFTRPSGASFYPVPSGSLVVVNCDEPRFEEIDPGIKALLVEPMRTNLFLDSSNPRTQIVHMNPGIYTIWAKGSGIAELILPDSAPRVAREGNPLVYIAKQVESRMIRISGDLERVQLETGEGATSYIETSATYAVTRASDLISLRPHGINLSTRSGG